MQKEEQGYGTCSDFDRLWFQLAADVFKENLLCFVINITLIKHLRVSEKRQQSNHVKAKFIKHLQVSHIRAKPCQN